MYNAFKVFSMAKKAEYDALGRPIVSDDILAIGTKYLKDGKVQYIKNEDGERISRPMDSTDARKWLDVRRNVKSIRDGTRET